MTTPDSGSIVVEIDQSTFNSTSPVFVHMLVSLQPSNTLLIDSI